MLSSVADNWYENFFAGINCEMWEKAVPEEWSEREAAFLLDVLQVAPGARILDVPCGTGRLALPLARKGFRVTGVDISVDFIKGLTQKVKAENLPVQIIQGNMLTLELSDFFDGAYCLGNSFGYFDYPGMQVFVKKVAAHLKPGGRFIINSGMVAESILPRIPAEKTYYLDGLTMQVNNEYLVNDSYLVSHLKYTKNQHSEEHRFKHYVYTLGEIKRLLSLFNLHVVALYSTIEKTPYQVGDAQVYLVAEKVTATKPN
ncbi:class I SAM-dependent methyltransferase [Adhaeribacter arboris]|uniref:Class I SAM-dependent methyltransferase n=1 Tax=Adhaeribacter arboris TaxID=2072846 RepID=A0A2T2YIP1_9BACT|nr:class I SAM-dependent methyltransferase [Adhaeribacter arboris]PSR55359.1 class I SAM-dependent methyltransferase [Adhaeribacter arboris]